MEVLPLPNNWQDIQPDVVYSSTYDLQVSFSDEQIKLGIRYDGKGKHLKAIAKGLVHPQGSIGLVDSQEKGYNLKSKVLGNGGDRRFHAKYVNGILHFPGFVTQH
ncbi:MULTISPECIES: hypothetical protein [Dolichospermum]|uniref:Uncharacterized protein n=1 Tax=Dolichospermum heterosporum TAC447 TaxID=747523 RepID=A0ABY5LV35_9CYAN|nr:MULTISPECIES: hypothetical protein [Dolichospermum]MBE9260299.1 hypothetical protein [Dolichospermum sp. LEGE 00246]UUO14884.1 hypothetical protein NG743_23200 [Dolichospermum heterosporum TAC447]